MDFFFLLLLLDLLERKNLEQFHKSLHGWLLHELSLGCFSHLLQSFWKTIQCLKSPSSHLHTCFLTDKTSINPIKKVLHVIKIFKLKHYFNLGVYNNEIKKPLLCNTSAYLIFRSCMSLSANKSVFPEKQNLLVVCVCVCV